MWIDSPRLQALSALIGSAVLALVVLAAFNRVVLRFTARTETELDDIVAESLRWPIAASIGIAGAYYAVHWSALPPILEWALSGVVLTALVLHWASGLSRGSARLLAWLVQRREQYTIITPRTMPVFEIGAKTVVFGGAAYFVLLAWHVDVTGWLASAGIIGIAVGFASQDTLANLIAGVFILADAPYKLGDYLVLDNGDRGSVVEIGIRTTRLMTRDDVEIIVPNKVMANARITNQSGGPAEAFRVRIQVGVAYGSDIDLVHQTLEEIARTTAGVLEVPEPRVRFRAFGDSSLDHEVLVWAGTPAERGQITHDLLTTIYKRFGELEIQIPFPQRDVHLYRASED